MTKTADTVMHALTAFINDWCAPASRRIFYQPGHNSYNRLLDVLARAIAPPPENDIVRYAVFRKEFDTSYDRDRPSGIKYTQLGGVFEKFRQVENIMESRSSKEYVICEIREYQP